MFDWPELDWRVEDRHFPDWECPLARIRRKERGPGRPSAFRVLEENGRPVLDHVDMTDRPLVVGDFLWKDYSVEAYVRQLSATSKPNSDDPHCFVGRSGLMFRYRTLRQYYFFCIEGYDRLVLYRREHAHWHVVGRADRAGGPVVLPPPQGRVPGGPDRLQFRRAAVPGGERQRLPDRSRGRPDLHAGEVLRCEGKRYGLPECRVYRHAEQV